MNLPIVLPGDQSLVVGRFDSYLVAGVLKNLLADSWTAPYARRRFGAFINAVEGKGNTEPLPGAAPGSSDSKLGSAEAARILGLTERRVRQLGHEIGGRQLQNRRWQFDPAAVYEAALKRGGT